MILLGNMWEVVHYRKKKKVNDIRVSESGFGGNMWTPLVWHARQSYIF